MQIGDEAVEDEEEEEEEQGLKFHYQAAGIKIGGRPGPDMELYMEVCDFFCWPPDVIPAGGLRI